MITHHHLANLWPRSQLFHKIETIELGEGQSLSETSCRMHICPMMTTTAASIPTPTFPPLTMNLTMNVGGSATHALERSLKLQRTNSNNLLATSATAALEAAFNLDQVFSSLHSPNEESFPSLSWDLDDEEPDTKPDDPQPMGVSSLKRNHEGVSLGIVRSKSLKRGLSSMTCSTVSLTKPLSSEKMAPYCVADMLKLSSASIADLSNSGSLALGLNPLMTQQLSRFGPSLLTQARQDEITNRTRSLLFPSQA
jgi:hypothetical protein